LGLFVSYKEYKAMLQHCSECGSKNLTRVGSRTTNNYEDRVTIVKYSVDFRQKLLPP
jgi:hypothetical protein